MQLFFSINYDFMLFVYLTHFFVLQYFYKFCFIYFFLTKALQVYQDQTQLSSTQFYQLLVNVHQILNESMGGGEKFEELLKFIENQQPQV